MYRPCLLRAQSARRIHETECGIAEANEAKYGGRSDEPRTEEIEGIKEGQDNEETSSGYFLDPPIDLRRRAQ